MCEFNFDFLIEPEDLSELTTEELETLYKQCTNVLEDRIDTIKSWVFSEKYPWNRYLVEMYGNMMGTSCEALRENLLAIEHFIDYRGLVARRVADRLRVE